MPSPHSSFFEDIQIVPQFEHLRSVLLQKEYQQHLNKPLAFWTLPTDRRLPLAFLNRTLYDILNTSFDDLCHTPSIGEKKIRSLLTLLARVAQTKEEELPQWDAIIPQTLPLNIQSAQEFDISTVSELQWQAWQQTALKHEFDKEKLGRLCSNLSDLTRVIWDKPIGNYCRLTLSEMRNMRTHGEKRVTAILNVFYNIHVALSQVDPSERLKIQLFPRNIYNVEQWTLQAITRQSMPPYKEILEKYTEPLLDQLKQDASEQILELARNRIGLDGKVSSVRQAARTLGLARARVYQLLNEINDILLVRWPHGSMLTSILRNKFLNEAENDRQSPAFEFFHSVAELFFPWGRREDVGETYFGILDSDQGYTPQQDETDLDADTAPDTLDLKM